MLKTKCAGVRITSPRTQEQEAGEGFLQDTQNGSNEVVRGRRAAHRHRRLVLREVLVEPDARLQRGNQSTVRHKNIVEAHEELLHRNPAHPTSLQRRKRVKLYAKTYNSAFEIFRTHKENIRFPLHVREEDSGRNKVS